MHLFAETGAKQYDPQCQDVEHGSDKNTCRNIVAVDCITMTHCTRLAKKLAYNDFCNISEAQRPTNMKQQDSRVAMNCPAIT